MENKRTKQLLIILAILSASFSGCKTQRSLQNASQHVLLNTSGWTIDTLRSDLIWYKYSPGSNGPFPNQHVNVLSFNTHSKTGKALAVYEPVKDSLSSIAAKHKPAIAGVNATYFLENKATINYMYLKLNGKEIQTVDIPADNIYYWKHKGIFTYDRNFKNYKIDYYPSNPKQIKAENVLTGAPVLIHNYKPVGAKFADTTGLVLKNLHYENPAKHQGVKHPRSAIALTEAGHLLLVTVDGRNKNALGMSAKDLTLFLKEFFNPMSAINIDGGGSTTMWINGQPCNGIVNYPTDNKKFDHFGQRKIETAILIK